MSASALQRPKAAGSESAALNRQIAVAGLLERRPSDVRISHIKALRRPGTRLRFTTAPLTSA